MHIPVSLSLSPSARARTHTHTHTGFRKVQFRDWYCFSCAPSLCQLSRINTLCCIKVLLTVRSCRSDCNYSRLHLRSKILNGPKQTATKWRKARGFACHPNLLNHLSQPDSIRIGSTSIPVPPPVHRLGVAPDHSPSNSTIQTSAKQIISNSEESVQSANVCWHDENACGALLLFHGLIAATVFWRTHLSIYSGNSRKKQQQKCSLSSLSVVKTWACFSASTYAPVASNLSKNQLQTFHHLFLFCTGSGWGPCWHSRFMFLQSCGPRSLAHQGATVWNKLPHVRNAASINSFKAALKTELFRPQTMYFLIQGVEIGMLTLLLNVCLCVCDRGLG